jgi:hypothetical protein
VITYQDLLAIPQTETDRAEFVKKAIESYKTSTLYQTAKLADEYDRCRNRTTMQYQKIITDFTGRQYIDATATVHRSCSNYFNTFVTQLNQYLLANGVSWSKQDTEKKLGSDFDTRLQEAGKNALVGAVSFGFYNLDHLEVFSALEFAPLYDEENGALAAGVRFWQIDEGKPLRATFYELDGYTNYLWSKKAPNKNWQPIGNDTYIMAKRPYKVKIKESEADGAVVYDGENYPTFPMVPLWGNPHHQSELVGLQEKIDAYDFILNGWEDDLDNAQLYWIIKGAGGMDDPDLLRFLDRLRTVKAAAPADGQEVDAVSVNLPVEAREKLLDRLEKQLYKDAMIMNPDDIAGGANTATQIRAAYEPQNNKADQYEYCINDFLRGIMKIAGVDDEFSFTRSMIVNVQEEVKTVILAAQYLDPAYVTKKIMTLMGDGDQAEGDIKPAPAQIYQMLDAGLMKAEEGRSLLTGETIEVARAALPGMEELTTEGQDDVE